MSFTRDGSRNSTLVSFVPPLYLTVATPDHLDIFHAGNHASEHGQIAIQIALGIQHDVIIGST